MIGYAQNYVLFGNNPHPPKSAGRYFGGWSGRTQRVYDIAGVHMIDGAWSVHCHLKDGLIGHGTMGPIIRAGAAEGHPRGWVAGWVMCTSEPVEDWEPAGHAWEPYVPARVFGFPRRFWVDIATLMKDPACPNRSPFNGKARFANGEELKDEHADWLISKLPQDLRGYLEVEADHLYSWSNERMLAAS